MSIGRTWYGAFLRVSAERSDKEWAEYRDGLVSLLTGMKLEGKNDGEWLTDIMKALQNADEHRRLHYKNDPDAPAG